MVCRYSFVGPVPEPVGGLSSDFNPINATITDRTCRTVPLKHVYLLDEVLFPSESKNSLRLAYFTQPQYLSLCFPQHPSTEKFKVSCPASAVSIDRKGDILRIIFPLSQIQYSRADPHPTAQYRDSSVLKQWVLASAVNGELVFECSVLGNSADEEGSGARLAHQFAEHVVVASSRAPPKILTTRGKDKGRANHPMGWYKGVKGDYYRKGYMKNWRE